MILVNIDLPEELEEMDDHLIVFVNLENFLKLSDFPENFNNYGDKPFFDLGIVTRDDDNYIEYCKKTGKGFYNLLKFFKIKSDPISGIRGFSNVYSPIVIEAFEEIKSYIKEKFDPKYVFGNYQNQKFDKLKELVNNKNNLIIPLFSRGEEIGSTAQSLDVDI
ncbi:hypothetical protein [Thermosipho globiformans]|uniref:hypothetical protein n=1 Tax=Thermosipho globiformans TaxID=380685 RepID=UPI000F8CA04F|nr:hypothetical protein [Thermosipho globiformans]